MGLIGKILDSIFSKAEQLVFSDAASLGLSGGMLPAENDVNSGDIELTELTMFSADASKIYELFRQAQLVNIYESILTPAIFCDIDIADAIGLMESFPILGEEFIKISFKTPGVDGKPASYYFQVNEIVNKRYTDNNDAQLYTLRCCSLELRRNSIQHLTKYYNDTASNVIKDVLTTDLETKKELLINGSVGTIEKQITKRTPFAVIDYFKKNARSERDESSLHVFYESRDGFVFSTLEKLIEDGAKAFEANASDKDFFFDTQRSENRAFLDYRNILAFNTETRAATSEYLYRGGEAQDVVTYDIVTGEIKKVEYKTQESRDKFKFPDGNQATTKNSDSYIQGTNKTTANTTFMPVSADDPRTQRAEKLVRSNAYLASIVDSITNIYIFGDSEIRIGDVIRCSLPPPNRDEQLKANKRIQSRYFVASIRHIISLGDRPQHCMAVELIKGTRLKDG